MAMPGSIPASVLSSRTVQPKLVKASTFSGPVSAVMTPAGIKDGTVLRCISDEGSAIIFENAASELEIGSVQTGDVVTVQGKPVTCDDFWMIPIRPKGAVQLDQFEKVELTAAAASERSAGAAATSAAFSGPLELDLMIIQATGLKKGMFARTPEASCSCEVPGKGYTTVKTRNVKGADPTWDEVHQISGYLAGDSLEFSIWDRETVIGQATMTSDQFLASGFEGFLKLSLEGAALRVGVARSGTEEAKSFSVPSPGGAQTFHATPDDEKPSASTGLTGMTFLSRLLPGRSATPKTPRESRSRLLRAAERVEVASA